MEIRTLRAGLAARAYTPDAAAQAAELYYLHGYDPLDQTGERAATFALFDGYAEAFRQPGIDGVSPELSERSALISLDRALRMVRVSDIRQWIDRFEGYKPAMRSAQIELAAARVEVLRREGRYRDALAALAENAETLGEAYVSVVEIDIHNAVAGEPGTSNRGLQTLADPGGEERGEPGVSGGFGTASEAVTSHPADRLYADALLPPYPNPARGQATIPVTVSDESAVTVVIYDTIGREVVRLADETFEMGRHPLRLDREALGAGVYLIRATIARGGAPAQTFTRRLTVVR